MSEQGQLTDRFARSVEELGSQNLDVRLGGIYALERLARNSSVDQPAIMEILAAFVRNHAGQQPGKECPENVAFDTQAALTVLGRRDSARDNPGQLIDVHLTCLHRVDLVGANLTSFDFNDADLHDANLGFSKIGGASFQGAFLVGADFFNVNTGQADFDDAVFSPEPSH